MADSQGRRAVSLTRPRPEANRSRNEYVDTPLRQQARASELHPAALHSTGRSTSTCLPVPPASGGCQVDNNNKKPLPSSGGGKVVTSQPGVGECSIICGECHKCRCAACRTPRDPPSAWLCSDLCYCSVDSAVDYASCLCCVKGALYHCWESQAEAADDPCSCGAPRPLARWLCLAAAAVPLPCLLCYWPFKSMAATSKKLYAACAGRGCTCPPHTGSLLPPNPH